MSTQATGQSGEVIARTFLEGQGLRFRAANVRSPFGEIDLVMEDPTQKELVFVEVKTRRGNVWGTPEESITAKKHAKLAKLVEWYRQKTSWPGHVRLDVIGIVLREGAAPVVTHTAFVGET